MARLNSDYKDLWDGFKDDGYKMPGDGSWKISRKEKAQAIAFIAQHNRLPGPEDGMDIFDNNDNTDAKAIAWMTAFKEDNSELLAKKWIENNPDVDPNTSPFNTEDNSDSTPFYFRPDQSTVEGTKENDMLKLYNEANDKTREIYNNENARAEGDLIKELDNQRRATLDEIRNRRRTMLKNGLSSAQIANEEVQSLMLANNNNRMIGQEFYNQRSQINNAHAENKAGAVFDLADRFNSYNQNGAAQGAVNASDADYIAKMYKENIASGKYTKTDYSNVVNPGGN